MKKHNLSSTGLSMSQAQSISNLCNLAAKAIEAKIQRANNTSKTITLDGEELTIVEGVRIPFNIIDEIQKQAKYYAAQSFLMENIKVKETLLNEEKAKKYQPREVPNYPSRKYTPLKATVNEDWGWEQLSVNELNEYLEQEAIAAHVGQLIHKNGKLDTLRKELERGIPNIEWMEKNVKGGANSIPVKVKTHHSVEELWGFHQTLAEIHKKAEQRVNYYKSKVKNLVTIKNGDIAEENGKIQAEDNKEFDALMNKYNNEVEAWRSLTALESQQFEVERNKEIKKISSLRINVDSRFQSVIDEFQVIEAAKE